MNSSTFFCTFSLSSILTLDLLLYLDSPVFRNCDLDTVVNFLAKQNVSKLTESNPKVMKTCNLAGIIFCKRVTLQAVREELMSQCATILACYR